MKLYKYKNAKKHVHDTMKMYINTVPLSEKGISQHFTITEDPTRADYFYMGQLSNDKFRSIRPEDFAYFDKNKEKHICDVEGEGGQPIPTWLQDSIITTMGPLKTYKNVKKLFTRPTFSHLLLDIIKNRDENLSISTKKSFGFRGFINHKIRAMMLHSVHNSNFPKEIHINRKWSGPSEVGGKIQQDYIDTMSNNLLSLCPRGSGIDSVRLIESCYYSRVPILISDYDYFLVGEENCDLDFVFRITGRDLSPTKITEQLTEIYNTPIEELQDRAKRARSYFDTTIRRYFEDPTLFFLNWLTDENNEKQ